MRHKKCVLRSAKGRTISSSHWLSRHINDPYVFTAKSNGYRSRAAMKLIEIDDRFKVIGSTVGCIIDLGSCPGSWLQVISKRADRDIPIIGIDIMPIKPLSRVHFIQGDFTAQETMTQLDDVLTSYSNTLHTGCTHNTMQHTKAGLILSDMSPATCGLRDADQARIVFLVRCAFLFTQQNLRLGGNFVTKIFMCEQQKALMQELRQYFKKVAIFKPKSSYSDSSENFIICMNKTR